MNKDEFLRANHQMGGRERGTPHTTSGGTPGCVLWLSIMAMVVLIVVSLLLLG